MALRSARKLRFCVWTVGVLCAGAAYYHWPAPPPYPFLAGKSPIDVTVVGPGSWPASETRTYTWKQNWREVVDSVQLELKAAGLAEEPGMLWRPHSASWESGKVNGGLCGTNCDRYVWIGRGKLTSKPPYYGKTDADPDWVTVTVSRNLDETPINVIRYTVFGYRD